MAQPLSKLIPLKTTLKTPRQQGRCPDGAPGPSRFGAETIDSVQSINTSDNLDEEDMSTSHRPSRTVPTDLLGGRRIMAADDTYFHVTPDIVAVEESNTPHTNTKVTLIDITYCLESGRPRGTVYFLLKKVYFLLVILRNGNKDISDEMGISLTK
jgi:hypothetical protein